MNELHLISWTLNCNTLAFGNAGLDNVFVDAEDAVDAVDIFLNVVGDGGRRVRDVKSEAPPGVNEKKLFCIFTDKESI